MIKLLPAIFVILISSCNTETPPTRPIPQDIAIDFTTFTNSYFIVNTYNVVQVPSFIIVNDINSFDSIFNSAGISDTSKLISANKFQTNFVIDILIQGTFRTDITFQSIKLNSGILKIYYSKSEPVSHPSFTGNNHALALVSNCSFDSIQCIENNNFLINPYIENH